MKTIFQAMREVTGDPHDPWHWFHLGSALRAAGEFEKAHECYRHVLKLDPDFHQEDPYRATILRREASTIPGWIANR